MCGCMCVSVCGCMCVFVCGCLWENVCVCGRNLFHIYPLLTLSLSPFLPPWITHPLPASLSVNVYTLLYSSTSVVLSWYTYTLHFTVHLSGKFNHFFTIFYSIINIYLKCSNLNHKNLLKHILFNVIKMYYWYPTLSKCVYTTF